MSFRKIKMMIYAVFFVVIGIALTIWGIKDTTNAKKKPIDIMEQGFDFADLEEGDHVVCDVDFLMDYFTYTKDDNGKVTLRVYALPQLEETPERIDIVDFIGLDINSNADVSFSDCDRLVEDSLEWWNSDEMERDIEPIHVDGIVMKMDDTKIGHFREYLEGSGVDLDEVDYESMEYYIVPVGKHNTFVILFGIALALVGVATAFFALFRRRA